MGVNTKALRLIIIIAATIVTAASVSVTGMIGWVGLVIPHLSRMLIGSDYRKLMPASMLMGACFLLLVDDVSRLATTAEIPIGILTAFIGAPFLGGEEKMSVKIENLSFAYGTHQVLKNISLEVGDGTLVNVLGPNGTGKSTLFRCILGLYTSYHGSIIVNGKDISKLNIRERAREMAFIPQSHKPVYDYDVVDVVLMSSGAGSGAFFSPKKAHVDRALDALERVGIGHLAHRPYTRISGGEQQLVLIARALAQNANTIIMDEPTSALDYGNTVRVLSCVRQLSTEGLTVIQSTHQPDQAFLYADKTLVLFEGEVLAYGSPKDAITAELISKIYGVEVEVNSLHDDRVRVCVPKIEIGR